VSQRIEKEIESAIIKYIRHIWWWCEGIQSGSVIIKKGSYTNRMILCSNWTPDIICLFDGRFIGIEVKKNIEEVQSWLKKEERYIKEWSLPKSYEREVNQINHKHHILKMWGEHILTCSLDEVMDKISKKDLDNIIM